MTSGSGVTACAPEGGSGGVAAAGGVHEHLPHARTSAQVVVMEDALEDEDGRLAAASGSDAGGGSPRLDDVVVATPKSQPGERDMTRPRREPEPVERPLGRSPLPDDLEPVLVGARRPPAASLSPNVVSVSSLSKTYGLPGIRLGWLMTQNADFIHTFLAAKEHIFISGSVLDEEVAYQYLQHKPNHLARIRAEIARKFAIVQDWIAEEQLMEWVEPQGGVVCFPRIKPDAPVDVERFYTILNGKYGTMVGPGHWFGAQLPPWL